jgi:dihydrodipicolinate synthase/N-acetylneuraminate lyase
MQLELTEQERQELLELVRNAYAELNPEIAHSMDTRYRETLRQRRALYEALLKRLGQNTTPAK